jgi:hypothetical protein
MLVFNRNRIIMMVEYDAGRKFLPPSIPRYSGWRMTSRATAGFAGG